jgi:hypothetical protein
MDRPPPEVHGPWRHAASSTAPLEERPWRLVLSPQGAPARGCRRRISKARGCPYALGAGRYFPPPQKRKNSAWAASFQRPGVRLGASTTCFWRDLGEPSSGLCRYAPSSSSRLSTISTSRSNERGSGGHGQRDLLHQPRGPSRQDCGLQTALEVSGISVQ